MKKNFFSRGKGALLEKLNCRSGFTLLEVLLSLTIFSLLLTAFFNFYRDALQGWSRESSAMELQQNARIALYEIIRELRYALELEGLNDESVLPLFDGKDGTPQGAKKVNYISSEGKKSEIAFNENKRVVTLQIEGGPPNELAFNVVRLDFFRYIPQEDRDINPPMIFVRLMVQEKDKEMMPKASFILQSSVRLQNIVR